MQKWSQGIISETQKVIFCQNYTEHSQICFSNMTTKHIKYTNEMELIQTKSSMAILNYRVWGMSDKISEQNSWEFKNYRNVKSHISHTKKNLLLFQGSASPGYLNMPQVHWTIKLSLQNSPTVLICPKTKLLLSPTVEMSKSNHKT